MNAKHSYTHSHFGDIAKQTTSRAAHSLFLTLGFVFIEAIEPHIKAGLVTIEKARIKFYRFEP